MKNILSIAAVSLLVMTTSCKKTTDGNTGIVKQDGESSVLAVDTTVSKQSANDPTNSAEYTERYIGDDGTSALVTFNNSGKEKTISIRSNNKTITAPQKEAWENGGVYGDFDIEIVAKNDSVTITQENNVITLKKARGN